MSISKFVFEVNTPSVTTAQEFFSKKLRLMIDFL